GMGGVIAVQQTPADHQALSTQLMAFAGAVREIVETAHRGALVYAGGDDVLAFLPLHTVLDCARALAERFTQTVGATLSVGVVVSHHVEPLSDVLALARAAERAAKAVPDKNALAITVSKRSGGDTTVAGSWSRAGGDWAALDDRLRGFAGLHRADQIPDGAAYELRALVDRLRDIPDPATLEPILRSEAQRILKRKKGGHGSHDLVPETLAVLNTALDRIAATMPHAFQRGAALARLADELIVARIFAAAYDQAAPPTADDRPAPQAASAQPEVPTHG
ncbi:MAG TPA: type III-B CRISPR-associated protein Cas10/Cmr2, partial [Chloroflexia bacterium]|nr:type III-B CRISPR-associated protein Cas10/Cmr2 [Chloroflexia bacterium]